MRPHLLTTLPLLASLAGCTAIADPGSFVHDTGCDLSLTLVDFDGPHLGQNLTVQIDSPISDANRQTKGLAMLVGIPAGDFTIALPKAVHYRDSVIDFFVDNTEPFGVYNPQNAGGSGRGDHSWTLTPACSAHSFTHVAQFDDFEEFPALDEDLAFELVGFGLTGQRVELLVTQIDPGLDAVDGDGDGRFVLAFQHTTVAAEGVVGRFVAEPLRGMLDRGASFRVEVFVDRDADGVVDDSSTPNDPADEGYVFAFSPDPADEPGTIRIPQAGAIELSAAMAGSDDHSGTAGVRFP